MGAARYDVPEVHDGPDQRFADTRLCGKGASCGPSASISRLGQVA